MSHENQEAQSSRPAPRALSVPQSWPIAESEVWPVRTSGVVERPLKRASDGSAVHARPVARARPSQGAAEQPMSFATQREARARAIEARDFAPEQHTEQAASVPAPAALPVDSTSEQTEADAREPAHAPSAEPQASVGEPNLEPRPSLRAAQAARFFAGMALALVAFAVGGIVRSGYYALTDSFVAPLILSPDSDLVLPSKLSLARLEGERALLASRVAQARAASSAAEEGAQRLRELMQNVEQGLGWARSITAQALRSSSHDLVALNAQDRLIRDRVGAQHAYVSELEQQMKAGLVRKADVVREQDALRELEVAALQVQRERVESSSQLETSKLAKRALDSDGNGRTVRTPEMLQQRSELIRIEIDMAKLEAERSTSAAELRHTQTELHKLDELIAQVRARPVFRAVESRQHVAFVPYSQLKGAVAGATVYECSIWGLFACDPVGVVTDLLPGEVAAQDPWGAVARGQYALLRLEKDEAAQTKILRLRASEAPPEGMHATVVAPGQR
jgi:hypothetical protein